MIRKGIFFLLMIGLVGLSSCSKYQKLLKSSDNELKYKKAIEYYDSGDYYRALQLFDQLLPFFRGTDKAEELNYYYPYCYFEQRDYIMAAYYFKKYANNYPNNKRAEECVYMSAYCKYLKSPEYSLDQTSTYDAISELQLFINMYPESFRVENCNNIIDKLREKLEKKAYHSALLYYKMERYKSAILSFKNVLKDFPDTKYREDILYHIIKLYYEYARNSITEVQKERYSLAVESYENLRFSFPESGYLKQAEKIYKNSLEVINN